MINKGKKLIEEFNTAEKGICPICKVEMVYIGNNVYRCPKCDKEWEKRKGGEVIKDGPR